MCWRRPTSPRARSQAARISATRTSPARPSVVILRAIYPAKAHEVGESVTRIARVQPLTRTRAVRGLFDYKLTVEQPPVEVGSLLRVPFGGRRTLGVVMELADRSELAPDRLAAPDAVLPGPLPPDLVALAKWMSREYCSTPARALGLVLAPGSSNGIRAKEVLLAGLTDQGREALRAEAVRLTDGQRTILQHLDRQGDIVAAELGTPNLRRLQSRGLVTLRRARSRRRPESHRVGAASARAPVLSPDQQAALDPILAAVRAAMPERFLLHGVTGSGKTEVYLR